MNHFRISLVLAGMSIATAAFAADAAENWENNCAACHGPDGRGDTKMGKKLKIRDMTDAAFQASFTDQDAAKAIKEGIKDKNGKTTMKAIEGLTDGEVTALVAQVRSFKK